MLYFTSDPHFGHANIIQHCQRPFASVEEMDNTIIANINNTVGQKDKLYIIGDFCLARKSKTDIKKVRKYRHWIKCRQVYLIVGNHDPINKDGTPAHFLHDIFTGVYNTLIVRIDKKKYGTNKIFLHHYANRTWPGSQYGTTLGSWHLFGHSHGNLPDDWPALCTDVSMDKHNFFPLSLDEVAIIMAKKKKNIEMLNQLSAICNK